MGDMNPTDYAHPYTAPINPGPCPTAADVAELRCRAISADAANIDAWAAYRKAKEAHRRGFDTARVLAGAEAKERAAAIVLRSARRATEAAYFAHIKATA
jgi:hypothetical protein